MCVFDLVVLLFLLQGDQLHLLPLLLLQHLHLQLLQELTVLIVQPGLLQLRFTRREGEKEGEKEAEKGGEKEGGKEGKKEGEGDRGR